MPGVAAVLETEYRQLAQEARSKEGLAGFFSSAADQQAVKDAAERVILKVRGVGDAPDAAGQIKMHYQVGAGQRRGGSQRGGGAAGRGCGARGCCAPPLLHPVCCEVVSTLLLPPWPCLPRPAAASPILTSPAAPAAPPPAQEVLKPLQLSLDTKSDRLKSRALAITQNLIANAALPAEASEAVTAMLGRVDKNTDENVQLKTLQTALTLLQSPLRPRSEEQIGAVLGVCLRLTNRKGHKDAVLTTAAATVRQAVALVLSYVDVEAELQGLAAAAQGVEGGEAAPPAGAAAAAQKLVEDLCNIASGGWGDWVLGSRCRAQGAGRAWEGEQLAVLAGRPRLPGEQRPWGAAGREVASRPLPPQHAPLQPPPCLRPHPPPHPTPPCPQARRRCGSSPPRCPAPLCWSCWTLCWPTRQTCSAACRPSRTRWRCA